MLKTFCLSIQEAKKPEAPASKASGEKFDDFDAIMEMFNSRNGN